MLLTLKIKSVLRVKGEREMRGKVEKWRNAWNWMEVKGKGGSGWGWQRRLLHEGPDTVEELLDRHLVKKGKGKGDSEEDELVNRRRLTSTRREALSLYRDILRASRFFTWPDSKGVMWRDVLRESARREFEQARFETDPETVTRLLIGGREAVHSAIDKLTQQIQKDRGGAPPHQR